MEPTHLNLQNMPKTAMIRARIEPKLKTSAENALKKMGFSPTEAITIFYRQVVIQKAIPFEVRLERDDVRENYIHVRDDKHLAELIGLKDVQTGNKQRSKKGFQQGSIKGAKKNK